MLVWCSTACSRCAPQAQITTGQITPGHSCFCLLPPLPLFHRQHVLKAVSCKCNGSSAIFTRLWIHVFLDTCLLVLTLPARVIHSLLRYGSCVTACSVVFVLCCPFLPPLFSFFFRFQLPVTNVCIYMLLRPNNLPVFG